MHADTHPWARRTGSLALLAALALGAVMLVPALLGFQRYVITGGSMAGALDRGSLAFARPVPTAGLRVGDVITYRPPVWRAPVTHRIAWIGRDAAGALAFQTKGDANAARDPWRFTLRQPTQARVAFSVPYVGWAFALLGLRSARIVLIGIPALLVGLSELRALRRPAEPGP